MADSVGDQIGDVLRRTKSRNWMLGTLRRRTSGRHSDAEIRDAIAALARQHRPARPDELERRRVDLSSRRPPVFLEPVHAAAWEGRVEQLVELVVEPMGSDVLLERGAVLFGGRGGQGRNRALQTLAASESLGALHYVNGRWQRERPDNTSALPSASTADGNRTASRVPLPGVAVAASAVQVRAAPLKPRPRRRANPHHPLNPNHPWKTKPMNQAPPTTPEKPASQPNGASGNGHAATAKNGASAPNGTTAAAAPNRKKPGPAKGTPKASARRPPPDLVKAMKAHIAPDLDAAFNQAVAELVAERLRKPLGLGG